MKRLRIRFHDEDRLVLAIDRLIEKIKTRQEKAEFADKEADYLYKAMANIPDPNELKGPELVAYLKAKTQAKFYREYSDMVRRNQPRYNTKLSKYKEALAKIRTIPFSFMEDASVVIVLIVLAVAIYGCSSVSKSTKSHVTVLPPAPAPKPEMEFITVYTPKGEVYAVMVRPDPRDARPSIARPSPPGAPRTKPILQVRTPGAAMPDLLIMESAQTQTVRKAKALEEVPLVFPYDFYWSQTGGMQRFTPGTMPDQYK